jgi:hypothetical protein
MHPSLQGMLDAAQSVRASESAIEKAFEDAFGIASDDPETPSVLAVVSRNRLIGFEIDESILDLYRNDPTALAVYVNPIIRGAFTNWRSNFAELARS